MLLRLPPRGDRVQAIDRRPNDQRAGSKEIDVVLVELPRMPGVDLEDAVRDPPRQHDRHVDERADRKRLIRVEVTPFVIEMKVIGIEHRYVLQPLDVEDVKVAPLQLDESFPAKLLERPVDVDRRKPR